MPDQSQRLGKVRCGLRGESTDDIGCYGDVGDPEIKCEVCCGGVLVWCVGEVYRCGVLVRCAGVVCWCGVQVWCVGEVCRCGVLVWCAGVVCRCGGGV